MAVRLHFKVGLVSEQDRLGSSTDAALVTEPSVGSVSRSKGNLYIVTVARAASGGRPREAAALVADTIRREYYYDESAGIPHCLEKAIRSANRRLRHGREGSGLQPGTIGVVVAVVRGHELYVATTGDAEAYLVRQARLLTLPDEERGDGLPVEDDPRVDVWRGDIAVGDTLLLVSANISRLVGTDELKNAVVTLHPQSAVEHLHHLFVMAGGSGSDGLLAIEATEIAATRAEKKLVAVRPAEPLAGAPDRSPIPLADPLVGAASAVQDRAREVRTAAGGALFAVVDALTGVMPRRGSRYRQITPTSARRESQQRAALALLSFLGTVLLLGVTIWLVGGAIGRDETILAVNQGENALATAQQRIDQVFGDGDLVEDDPERALRLLREAWAQLASAEEAGVSAGRIRPLRERIAEGLDRLYAVRHPRTQEVYDFDTRVAPDADVRGLVRGPDGATYTIDAGSSSVVRVALSSPRFPVIVRQGDGPSGGIDEPWLIDAAGPDLLIVDRAGGLWRWRPSDQQGSGTLNRIPVGGDTAWGRDIIDVGTYMTDVDAGLYNFYVLDPSSQQILRYQPTADGSGFPGSPTDYLATKTNVSGFRHMYIDGDIFLVAADRVAKYETGRADRWELAEPPDAADTRPGKDYRLLAGTGPRGAGRLYVWDAAHERILVADKENGEYIEQFVPAEGDVAFSGLRGMYVLEQEEGPPQLYWATADRMYVTTLEDADEAGASPSPSGSVSPSAVPSGSVSVSPSGTVSAPPGSQAP